MASLYYLLLFIPLATSTSTFKQSRDTNGVISYRCPGKYVASSPWYPDDEDCGCYYVCGVNGDAVRMCCPTGLWWDHATKTCMYFQDFSTQEQEKCQTLARGVGTTKQLREIFIGRCWEYQRFVNPTAFQDGYRDCEEIFDSFARTFVNKAPCKEVKPSDYAEAVEKSTISLQPDSQIFWSGTYGLAQEYAAQGRRGFTLEATMIGYILNDVTWCGATVTPGINFESCPAFASCPDHVMASFWAKALESFASQAQGVVTVILNGSRADGPAFRNNSFFAEHELPNLDPERVSKIRVWVAHDLDRAVTETCTSGGSIWTLKQVAADRGIAFECEDNPTSVLHLLCAYQPLSGQCEFVKPPSGPAHYQPEPPTYLPDLDAYHNVDKHVNQPNNLNGISVDGELSNIDDPYQQVLTEDDSQHNTFKQADPLAYKTETVTDPEQDNGV